MQGQIFFGSSKFISKMQELLGEKKEIGEIPRAQRYPGRPALPDFVAKIANKQDRDTKIMTAHIDYVISQDLTPVMTPVTCGSLVRNCAVKQQKYKLTRHRLLLMLGDS